MKINDNKSLNFPVVVTSFEILMIDRPHLERHLWQVRRNKDRKRNREMVKMDEKRKERS